MPQQNITINFQSGLNTKTDPFQLPIGQFLSLENSVFQKGGLLSKREGYLTLPSVPPSQSLYLTTLSGDLLAIGDTVSANSTSLDKFITKGNLQPCSVSVLPLIRDNLNQIQTDSTISNGLILVIYTQITATNTGQVTNYLYAIEDAVTGQNIVEPTAIPPLSSGAISGSSRVFVVGNFFVIVSPVLIGGVTFLQYVSISISNPSAVGNPQNIYPQAYIPLSSNPGWDGAVGTGGNLLIAYNTTAGSQRVDMTVLQSSDIENNLAGSVVNGFIGAGFVGGIVSVSVDTTVSPNVFYISFFNPNTNNLYTGSIFLTLGVAFAINIKFAPQIMSTSLAIQNITSVVQDNVNAIYAEVQNFYSYAPTVPSNYIISNIINNIGTTASPYVVIRSVGLASKAFIVAGIQYFLAAFQSPFQPSYFLIKGSLSTAASPSITAKLAYQNGGGYLAFGLPSITVIGNIASMSYLYKQDVEAINTLSDTQQTSAGGIYSQLGINQVSFELGTTNISTEELAGVTHISGGYLAMFDGMFPVEHNFFVFPEPIVATYNPTSTVTPTGSFASGSVLVTVSSATGIFPGMSITGTGIPAGTVVVYVNGLILTLSNPSTSSGSAVTLTIQGNVAAEPASPTSTQPSYFYIVTYEWTDAKGNAYRSQPSIPISVDTSVGTTTSTGTISISFPMLRLTQKVFPPGVKIVIYRWSLKTQVYNEVTSILSPVLNDTTIDSGLFVDTLSDNAVIGKNLLYTTGGVQPDSNAPASNILSIFDTRLFLVDAEDPNLLYLSKTVIENTPVEMPLTFTIYVAPNIGTVSSSGPITALFPMDDKLIIFKNNSIFYINGTGPDNLGTTSPGSPLGNYSQPIFITSVVGCTNQSSIVLTQDGLMFQSDKGIWIVTRDLQTNYIGSPVEEFNQSSVTSANVIPNTNFVIFTLNTGEFLMYDYFYQQWGTWNGVRPVLSSCIYQGLHTVLTVDGQILQQTPGNYLDATDPVLMQFTTSWLNLASITGYERFYEMYLLASFLSPHKLDVQVAYDYNSSIRHQSTISPKNYSSPIPAPFGVPTPVGTVPQLEYWRVHAKKQLCQSFQISIQEVFDLSSGTIAGAGFTMSGIDCKVMIKRATRPIRGANAVG